MMNKKILIVVIILAIVSLIIFWQFRIQKKIYPTSPVENVGNTSEKKDSIRLSFPLPNDTIKSPLIITGEARGNWFFEGSFPVTLVDWDGLIIAQGMAKAESEWTTADFVPFTAILSFKTPSYKNSGSLILKKDNPSGLSANDDSLEIPILFNK